MLGGVDGVVGEQTTEVTGTGGEHQPVGAQHAARTRQRHVDEQLLRWPRRHKQKISRGTSLAEKGRSGGIV